MAAREVGATGVLNLELTGDLVPVNNALEQLAAGGRGLWGIKLATGPREILAPLLEALPARIPLVVCSDTPRAPGDGLTELVERLRPLAERILLEVTDAQRCRLGVDLGVDGFVAKGLEAGGWTGEEGALVLVQRVLRATSLPVWAHGGIGLHTVAACQVAGAAGAVLNAQVLLTRESPLSEAVRAVVARMDGSETACAGASLGAAHRMYFGRTSSAAEELRRIEQRLRDDQEQPVAEILQAWRDAVRQRIGWGAPDQTAWPIGQDGAFAGSLARRFTTVAGVIDGLRASRAAHVSSARTLCPLDEGAPLARAHGTRYPIVQGPMTRVSDRAEFALGVAKEGALPFLALALLPKPEVETLLEETRRILADRPWGVGILGFVPEALRQEQLEVVRRVRPPFALIAGGRPDQARALEEAGIHTYLHVPSPELLRLFVQDGARRFVLEGRECGGHVGPRTSFVLWNTAVDVLLDELPSGDARGCHVIFAGGIHDALSAAMVASIAAPLAERGVAVGVLLGTAYLFTREAVTTGAILPGFQEAALACRRTVLLETGPGHSTRCVPTPYAEEFEREKRRLLREGRSAEEIRERLEMLNVGRLRIASKGVTRGPALLDEQERTPSTTLRPAEQHRQGLYMIGQLAAQRDQVTTIAELHEDVAAGSTRRLGASRPRTEAAQAPAAPRRDGGIAIVGMSALLPKAANLRAYWENILNKVNAIVEIPKSRWDWELYFDPDPKAPDKIYSRWGGFIDEVAFDPLEFGMPPSSLPSIDPMQLLALKAAKLAIEDAGYATRSFDRERASVILGASGGTGDLGTGYMLRASLPQLFGDASAEIIARAEGMLPGWTEDSFAGLLPNVVAGRISNRFDFGGMNYVVDAACASSLSAVHVAVKELESGSTDCVLAGGFDTTQTPFGYLCFSKTHALSPTGQPRTFDTAADGIAIGEGVVMVVLKRLADAERDGDRIYAVIRSVEGSSDGRAKGLTAPRAEGQMLALERTYARARVSPTTVGLFEAHGTGTVVGDQVEALALSTFLDRAGATPRSAAIGSVKSMIGHTKAAAGVAGLAKVAMALYHKVLPPTLGVTQPNRSAGLGVGPLYVNAETRPWVHAAATYPRRAGVSAFGFGGTNFHALLEEYQGRDPVRGTARSSMPLERWPSELFVWCAASRRDLLAQVAALETGLGRGTSPDLASLSHAVWRGARTEVGKASAAQARLAIVAASLEDLRDKLGRARAAVGADRDSGRPETEGMYLGGAPKEDGRVAFLFPGESSAYPNMVGDLAVMFAEVREEFELMDRVLDERFPRPLSQYIFPPPAFDSAERVAQRDALAVPGLARSALGAASVALVRLLEALGVVPDLALGDGHGEYVALRAAGVLDDPTLAGLSVDRTAVPTATPRSPRFDVFSSATGAAYPRDLGALSVRLAETSGRPMDFAEQLERAWAAGARVFVEAGPSDVLTAVVSRVLGDRAHLTVAVDAPGRSGLEQLQHTLGRLAAAGVPVDLGRLFEGRAIRELDPSRLEEESAATALSPTTWLVDGHRARPASSPSAAVGRSTSVPTGAVASPETTPASARLAANGDRKGATPPMEPMPAKSTTPAPAEAARASATAGAREESRAFAPADPVAAQAPARARAGGDLAPPPPIAESREVMLRFQGLMNRFLQTQQNVMSAFLKPTTAVRPLPRPASATSPDPLPRPAPAPTPPSESGLAESQLATAQRPEPEAGLVAGPTAQNGTAGGPARTGRPEPAGTARQTDPAPAIVPAAAAALAPPPAQLADRLLAIVSERTGYPQDMLDLDADLEADLGIDSIKRVEILGTLQRSARAADVPAIRDGMEELARVKTLRGIVQWVERAGASAGGAPERPAVGGERDLAPPSASPLPLLRHAALSAVPGGVDVLLELDPRQDLYLDHHVLDGKPVFPAAMALELMAEIVQTGWAPLTFVGFRDVRMFRGIVLETGRLNLRVQARAVPESPSGSSGRDVHVEIHGADVPGRPYYVGTVNLARALPEAPVHRPTLLDGLGPFPLSIDEAYRRWLFHGPILQGITAIRGISERGLIATCRPSSPATCLAGSPSGTWLIDPVAVDSGLQLALLWGRAIHDFSALPSRLGRYRRFRPLPETAVEAHLETALSSDGHVVRSILSLVCEDGRLAGRYEGLECVGSRAVNRLMVGHRGPSDSRSTG